METKEVRCISSKICFGKITEEKPCPKCGITWNEYIERKKFISAIVAPYAKKISITSFSDFDEKSKKSLFNKLSDEEKSDIDNGIKVMVDLGGKVEFFDTRGVFFQYTDTSELIEDEGVSLNKLKEKFFKEFPKKNIKGAVFTPENELFFKSFLPKKISKKYSSMYEIKIQDDPYENEGMMNRESKMWEIALSDNKNTDSIAGNFYEIKEKKSGKFTTDLYNYGVEPINFSHNNVNLQQAKEWFEKQDIEVTVCLPKSNKIECTTPACKGARLSKTEACPKCGLTWEGDLKRKKIIRDYVSTITKKLNLTSFEEFDEGSKMKTLKILGSIVKDKGNGLFSVKDSFKTNLYDTRGVFLEYIDSKNLLGEEGNFINDIIKEFNNAFSKKKTNDQVETDEETLIIQSFGTAQDKSKEKDYINGLFDLKDEKKIDFYQEKYGAVLTHSSNHEVSLKEAKVWFEKKGVEVSVFMPLETKIEKETASYKLVSSKEVKARHHFGGPVSKKDPVCDNCSTQYQRIATLDFTDPELKDFELKHIGSAPLYFCNTCDRSPGIRFINTSSGEVIMEEDNRDNKENWDKKPTKYKTKNLALKKVKADTIINGEWDTIAAISRELNWVQSDSYFECPTCKNELIPVAQIPGKMVDEGYEEEVFYVYACKTCPIIAVEPQHT